MRAQANTLCQLRTGINRQESSLGKIDASDKRSKETVDHFLFRCGKWSIARTTHKFRELAGNGGGQAKAKTAF